MPNDKNSALCAPYSGREGVLSRANSAYISRLMRDHWRKPANCAQALALLAQWEAEDAQERVQRSHLSGRERREKERKERKKSA